MKKILILTRQEERESYDQKQTYTKGLGSITTKCEYTIEEFETLIFRFDGTRLQVCLADCKTDIAAFDAVFLVGWFKTKLLEDVALSVSLYLQSSGVKVLNSEAIYMRSRSKLSQYVHAVMHNIAVTPFVFSMSSERLAYAITSLWQDGYPVIMKGVQSNRGNDNYLLKTQEDALKVAENMNPKTSACYIVQTFVPNDGDYRIIVMGEKISAVIHRRSQSESHLNNTSQGGVAALYDSKVLPQKVIDDSIKLAKALRREVAGIDMIQHKETGQYYLLEINNMPQMATGSYVSEKLARLDEYFAAL